MDALCFFFSFLIGIHFQLLGAFSNLKSLSRDRAASCCKSTILASAVAKWLEICTPLTPPLLYFAASFFPSSAIFFWQCEILAKDRIFFTLAESAKIASKGIAQLPRL
jgi:hypothetical protein